MFSVIIPLYNKENSIGKTIESVVGQTFHDFEIIVINDGSTDNSAQVVDSIQDDRIRMVRQNNQGVSAARNNGIIESRYNWLAFLDGDDEWVIDYLEHIYKAIKKDPECIAYCTNYKKIDFYGKTLNLCWKYVPENEGRIDNYYKSAFFSSPIVTSSSVCVSKRGLESEGLINLFPLGVKSGEDLDSWVKILANNDLFVVNKKLVTIKVVGSGLETLRSRSGAEFDYKEWFKYQCDSPSKGLWLKAYAFKKLYKSFKKILVLPVLITYEIFWELKRYWKR